MTRSELSRRLSAVIPNADLEVVALPEVPGIRLALLQQSYPQHLLDNDTVAKIMNTPMYWAILHSLGGILHLLWNSAESPRIHFSLKPLSLYFKQF